MRINVLSAIAALSLTVGVGGCSSAEETSDSRTLTVYAAASLTETFTELGEQFEKDHPGVTVAFSFGGSADLVAQIQQGAPADVFASADVTTMQKLLAEELEGMLPVDFATNTLEIVTPPDNPAGIRTLKDLTRKGVDLVLCAPEVPCGSAARTLARVSGLTFNPVSEEQSVKDVLAKVAAGEADAGLVYVTDAKAADDAVEGIGFPESASAVNTYPITTLEDSENAELANEFVDFVLSVEGQGVLANAGFAAPR